MEIVKKKFKIWRFVLVWALVIFLFSSFPTVKASKFFLWDFLLKKTAHFVEYAVFAILIYRALLAENVKNKKALIFPVLISGVYAVTDEFHQSFVLGREPSLRDVTIDTLGAVFGVCAFTLNKNKLFRNLRKHL